MATRLTMATAFIAAMMIGSPAALAQGSGCTYDTQCKGDRICEKGVCISATLPKNFPASSTGRELGGSRVIKTTREDCELRGGVHRPTNDPQAAI